MKVLLYICMYLIYSEISVRFVVSKLLGLRFYFNLNLSCLQIKLICNVRCYSVSLINYNGVTFRIISKKRAVQWEGKDFHKKNISHSKSQKNVHSSNSWLHYIQGWLKHLLFLIVNIFLEALTFKEIMIFKWLSPLFFFSN